VRLNVSRRTSPPAGILATLVHQPTVRNLGDSIVVRDEDRDRAPGFDLVAVSRPRLERGGVPVRSS
jgi:hypothetical protein